MWQPGVGGTLKLDMPVGKFQQVMGLTPAAEEQKGEVPEPLAQTTGNAPSTEPSGVTAAPVTPVPVAGTTVPQPGANEPSVPAVTTT